MNNNLSKTLFLFNSLLFLALILSWFQPVEQVFAQTEKPSCCSANLLDCNSDELTLCTIDLPAPNVSPIPIPTYIAPATSTTGSNALQLVLIYVGSSSITVPTDNLYSYITSSNTSTGLIKSPLLVTADTTLSTNSYSTQVSVSPGSYIVTSIIPKDTQVTSITCIYGDSSYSPSVTYSSGSIGVTTATLSGVMVPSTGIASCAIYVTAYATPKLTTILTPTPFPTPIYPSPTPTPTPLIITPTPTPTPIPIPLPALCSWVGPSGTTYNGTCTTRANCVTGIPQQTSTCSELSSEYICCGFFRPPNSGTLIVKKTTTGGNGTFSYGLSPGPFTPFTITTTGTTAGGSGSHTISALQPGTYTVTELVPDGWTPTSPTSHPIEITSGGAVLINFTNERKAGYIEIHKETTGGDGVFNFSIIGPATTYLSVATSNGYGYTKIFDMPPGTYTVTENVSPGWVAKGPTSCTLTIPSDNYTCTFSNERPETGYLRISKTTGTDIFNLATYPEGIFTYNISSSSESSSFPTVSVKTSPSTFFHQGSGSTTVPLLPGTYTVTENVPSGWVIKSSNPQTVTIEAGQTFSVTFNNLLANALYGKPPETKCDYIGGTCVTDISTCSSPNQICNEVTGSCPIDTYCCVPILNCPSSTITTLEPTEALYPFCGNGICDSGEDSLNCIGDCGGGFSGGAVGPGGIGGSFQPAPPPPPPSGPLPPPWQPMTSPTPTPLIPITPMPGTPTITPTPAPITPPPGPYPDPSWWSWFWPW